MEKLTLLFVYFEFMVIALAAPSRDQKQTGYVEYRPGNLNVILASPHGGPQRPDSIPDRPSEGGCWDGEACIFTHDCENNFPRDPVLCRIVVINDFWTLELTEHIADRVEERFGRRPHVVLNLLHRSKMDGNRHIEEAAFGNPEAEAAWWEFQNAVNSSKAAIGAMGLFIDVHGHGHIEPWIELGYLHSSSTLDNGSFSPEFSSIRNLAQHVSGSIPYESLLRGQESFGKCMEDLGYEAVPAPNNPSPQGGGYFSGGYNTRYHGSRYAGVIDGLQIESPRILRSEEEGPGYAVHLAQCIHTFMTRHYPPYNTTLV